MAADAVVTRNHPGSALAGSPYFAIPVDSDALQVFGSGIKRGAGHEVIAAAVVKSMQDWIVPRLVGLRHPGLRLTLGFCRDVDLLNGHSLHLYAVAVADRVKELTGIQFSNVRVVKKHDEATILAIGEAVQVERPAGSDVMAVTTRRSYATPAFGEEIRDATQHIRSVARPGKPLHFHGSYVTGLPRTWSRLWSPTISGVFMLQPNGPWTDSDRIVELGFDHRSIGEQLGHRVELTLSASVTVGRSERVMTSKVGTR